MDFTPRMKQILQILLKEEGSIPVKKLAEEIGISKRTVQRELGYMEKALKPYRLDFVSRTGVGVRIEGQTEDKHSLLSEITSGDFYDVGNKEERRKRLILEILKEKGLKKLFYYSSRFQVSEATISTDLDAIEEWLNQYGLFIRKKPGSGIEVEGGEADYRRAIRAFIDENIDTSLIREAYETDESTQGYEGLQKSNVAQILNDDILKRVINCIMGMNNARVLTLTENSYVGLVIHISIAINRILKNETLKPEEGWEKKTAEDEDYHLSRQIVRELEEEFEIEIPEVEVSYIWLHIKGAKHEKIPWDKGKTIEMGSRELQQLINDMIDVFDEKKAYYLKQDDEFIQGLLAHLQPTLIRLVYGMKIQNPVLEDIKRSYPEIYDRCRKVSAVLEKKINKQVPEEETGFLAVHFGAAIVRMDGRNEKIRQVHAGVVCSSGVGISRLMSTKLEKIFRDRMTIATYGKNDITPYVIGKTDFFISSLPLEQKEIPVIPVNPLLSEDDIEEIRRMVYQYERMPEKRNSESEFTHQLDEINVMAAQINAVIKYMEFFKVDNWITLEELLIAIGEKMSPYSDRSQMIQDDIMRREKIGTQVFAEFGFALFHTRTKGVIRPSFSVCMTRDLSAFKDQYFKGISVIFVMLVPEDENLRVNSEILGYISTLLIEEYEFMEVVMQGDKEEIRGCLSSYLKKFFNKYLSGL
ncbi:MAG: BglG family transcription antiterminator [Eubacteriales bacterium]|nr:BglG family transcription antiterminator [Eubacteriales bacterium]